MKKIYLLTALFFIINSLFADEIDEMINKINNKREAKIPKKVIESTPSPMPKLVIDEVNNSVDGKKVKKVVIKSETELVLKAIVNNSANINGKWVKVGETIDGYKLADVMEDSVYLVEGNKSKMLFFEQNNTKINIKIGR